MWLSLVANLLLVDDLLIVVWADMWLVLLLVDGCDGGGGGGSSGTDATKNVCDQLVGRSVTRNQVLLVYWN